MAPDEPKIGSGLELDDDLILSRVRDLVARGLERYGAGDLEGAMSEWEHALALDPDNAQAREYVEYVQKNIDVLDATFRAAKGKRDPSAELEMPFGLEEIPAGEGGDDYESFEIGGEGDEEDGAGKDPDLDSGWTLDKIPVAELVGSEEVEEKSASAAEPKDGATLDDALDEISVGLDASLKADAPAPDSGPEPAAVELEAGPPAMELQADPPPAMELQADPPPAMELQADPPPAMELEADPPPAMELQADPPPAMELQADPPPAMELQADPPPAMEGEPAPPPREPAPPAGAASEAGLGLRDTVNIAALDDASSEFDYEEATRELPPLGVAGDDEPTTRWRGEMMPQPRASGPGPSLSFDDIVADLRAELDAATAADAAAPAERVRKRVSMLLARAEKEYGLGALSVAVVAIDLALSEAPESAAAENLIHQRAHLLREIYRRFLGAPTSVPALAVTLRELERRQIDHRAAFLLSRIDGTITLEDLLDVSGMSALEAFQHLSRLVLQGILEVR